MILAMLCGVPATGLCFVEDDPFTTIIAPAIQKHCAKCHGTAAEVEADLNLATLRGGSLANNTELIRILAKYGAIGSDTKGKANALSDTLARPDQSTCSDS